MTASDYGSAEDIRAYGGLYGFGAIIVDNVIGATTGRSRDDTASGPLRSHPDYMLLCELHWALLDLEKGNKIHNWSMILRAARFRIRTLEERKAKHAQQDE